MEKNRFFTVIGFLMFSIISVCVFTSIKCNYDEKPTLNVLMMHMVTKEMPEDKELDTLYITDEMLRRYCKYFGENYTVVSLNEAYDIFKNNKKVDNPNLVAFTFDDGYDNNYILAYPILEELNVKANINIIARYTEEERDGYLTWDDTKEMAKSGLIEFGSHTYDSHYYITASDGFYKPVLKALLDGENAESRRERIFTDLKLADDLISENVGKVNIMTYPYGVPPTDLTEDIANEFGYDIQVLVRPGVNRSFSDFSELKRFTVNGNETPEKLECTIKKYNGIKFLAEVK